MAGRSCLPWARGGLVVGVVGAYRRIVDRLQCSFVSNSTTTSNKSNIFSPEPYKQASPITRPYTLASDPCNWLNNDGLTPNLLGTPLCPYGIAYCRACGLSNPGS